MKRSPLPLLVGAVIGIQALLPWLPAQAETKADQHHKVLYWYDPMRPEQHFDKPGKSPFMDMALVPEYADEVSGVGTGDRPVVSIGAATIQKMGVRTAKVEKSALGGTLRATGIVMDNERARHDVFTQVEGRIEDLKVSAQGDPVKKGEVFYSIVSPDLVTLQNDYIAALSGGMKDLAAAVARRMKLLDVDSRVIAALAKTRKACDKVPFYVPADGVLTRLDVRNGAYLKAGDMVGQIQDLSTVWVEAAVPEGDLPTVKAGDSATIIFTGDPHTYHARVDYIYPTINAETRDGKVRLIVDNKDGSLKPAGYATVEFAAATTERLTVPSEAILRGSAGSHVIIALGGGKFQARDVVTGATGGGQTEILSGLKEGEDVVTSAQFMIDSESNLQESLQKLSAPVAPKQGDMNHDK
ncbi:MAG: efflux RND transporter periplasmic adaptor subunit [Pseudomonadota bacterium]|nr:efflux RND transporter periplasmic adaptor subunit [Pseudomonadota bacterium]MDE3038578.1 efflux RND transporter periplasmic adaptor subunit [Pseudomonadota bacterium]